MLPIIAVLLVATLCNAKPTRIDTGAVVSVGTLGIDNYIIGGANAARGDWPWQLSQQRLSSGLWSHSCGASLLSTTKALSASHCVDGATADILRVIAGLYAQSDLTGTQTTNVVAFTMHERYQVDTASYSNDVAILNLENAITIGPGTTGVQLLTLPPAGELFTGVSCTITGWGRTSISNNLPDILQQANINVIDTAQCAGLMSAVSGTQIWDNHLCLYDSANRIGSCNGDSGGPCNCPNGANGYYVAGITSWGVSSSFGRCLQTYPSVYTRVSSYLDWINAN